MHYVTQVLPSTVLFFSCKTGDLNIAGTVYLQNVFLVSRF